MGGVKSWEGVVLGEDGSGWSGRCPVPGWSWRPALHWSADIAPEVSDVGVSGPPPPPRACPNLQRASFSVVQCWWRHEGTAGFKLLEICKHIALPHVPVVTTEIHTCACDGTVHGQNIVAKLELVAHKPAGNLLELRFDKEVSAECHIQHSAFCCHIQIHACILLYDVFK